MSITKSPDPLGQAIKMNSAKKDDFPTPGTVALVGAGPGDPDLLTLGALKALQTCDVVVYDALVSSEVRALIPEGCEQIPAGKRGGQPSAKQKDITETLVQLAKEKRRVVRLKGGDPFVFGRGGEEAERLVEAGIPFRVLPGLTAGTAGPAYAGIPITHRAVNANVAFITGHESLESAPFLGADSSRIEWDAVAKAFPVVVFYMAMKNLDQVTKRLMEGGHSPETLVAIIRWATTPQQQTLVTTLANAVRDATTLDLASPAIIVVGEVVRYRETLSWFQDETLTVKPNL